MEVRWKTGGPADVPLVMDIVVDSCVIISAMVVEQNNHDAARAFFHIVDERKDTVWAPATIQWEIACTINHPRKWTNGRTLNGDFRLPLQLMPVTEQLFEETWMNQLTLRPGVWHEIRSPLKAADRLFISCALARKAPLITWDAQVLQHAAQYGVSAIKPDQYMSGDLTGRRIVPPSDQELLPLIAKSRLLTRRETLADDDPFAIAIDLASGAIEAAPEHLDITQHEKVMRLAETLRRAWQVDPPTAF